MKLDDKENLPPQASGKHQDPFLAAIARNPHPLIMVMVGVIGMPLLLWLSAPDAKDPAPQQPAAGTRYETGPLPIERVTPALEELPGEALPDAPLEQENPAASSDADTEANPVGDSPLAAAPSITLIIDDIGYNLALGARAIALPGAVTYAVLPHTPHGAELAETAFATGKEIMLHAPMSNQANMALGPGGLTDELSKAEFIDTLQQSIAAVPHLQGVNNHMGSALTEQEEPMHWVMEVLKEHTLFFVDSLTTGKSVAGRIAHEEQIPTISRNVFLDNVQTQEAIDGEFQKLLKMAKDKGVAVGIGHPYPETLAYLEGALPLLEAEGIVLISASTMIELQTQLKAAW